MDALEVPIMIAALVFMFAAVGAKVATTQLLARMNNQISRVTQTKQEALNRLKGVQGQKAVAEQNVKALEMKKAGLTKKIKRLQKEAQQFAEEEQVRKQRTAMRKVD